MGDNQGGLHAFAVSAVAVIMVVFAIAACTVNDARIRGQIIQTCLERTENPAECAVLGSEPLYRR